uniref:AAA+ ATPase domain-containing protein n=1 Tax=Rhizochromulina marina TaxID=1034831 RepID=A0A7S2RX34_9STRA|mmetsp:Transcript_22157/g.64327  ORF Transcript_22157/g.64327 Transcript_22157/m.64327 type:complete len:610 (+) Transcript_22157:26-1855(+)
MMWRVGLRNQGRRELGRPCAVGLVSQAAPAAGSRGQGAGACGAPGASLAVVAAAVAWSISSSAEHNGQERGGASLLSSPLGPRKPCLCAEGPPPTPPSPTGPGDLDDVLTDEQLRSFLLAQLTAPRAKYRRSPPVRLKSSGDPDSCISTLSFDLSPGVDWLSVLSALLKPLEGLPEPVQVQTRASGQPMAPGGGEQASVAVILPQAQGSFLLTNGAPGVLRHPGDVPLAGNPPPPPTLSRGFALSFPTCGVVTLLKDGGITRREVQALVAAYTAALAHSMLPLLPPPTLPPGVFHQAPSGGLRERGGAFATGPKRPQQPEDPVKQLHDLGLEVYEPSQDGKLGWDSLAGYESLVDEIENSVVMSLRDPERFEAVAHKTRARYESNRPRAVLFEGPPGTGKTLTARILASTCGKPMVHVKTEKLLSKWYGEASKNFSAMFDACEALGAVVFIDEVDALATSRDSGDMHEATRRILSVLLQRVEGFEQGSKSTLICATNRRSDLDSALLSRFDLQLRFDLPNDTARLAVFQRYAKQLPEDDARAFASAAAGLSCRDIKEVCEHTERRWVAKLIRKEVPDAQELPPLKEYLHSLDQRLKAGGDPDAKPIHEV